MKIADITIATLEQANLILLIFTGTFLLIGIVFFFVSFLIRHSHNKKLRDCTKETTGEILRYEAANISSRISDAESHPYNYYPVVKYTVNNKEYELTWNYGQSKKGPLGATKVRYNPNSPTKFYLPGFETPVVLYRVFFAVSIGCIIIGIAALIARFIFF